MQGLEPTDQFKVYNDIAANTKSGTHGPWKWNNQINNEVAGSASGAAAVVGTINTYVVPVADNVIALSIWPRPPLRVDSTGQFSGSTGGPITNFLWDSQAHLGSMPNPQDTYDEQMPPIVELTAVVIDEASAARLDALNAINPAKPPTAIVNAFNNAMTSGTTLFTTEANYTNDITKLSAQLALANINFKIFNTFVVMRESKWSQ